jgi:hypothetical protein
VVEPPVIVPEVLDQWLNSYPLFADAATVVPLLNVMTFPDAEYVVPYGTDTDEGYTEPLLSPLNVTV